MHSVFKTAAAETSFPLEMLAAHVVTTPNQVRLPNTLANFCLIS